MVLVAILFIYPEVYSLFLVAYTVIKLIKKKKLPAFILISNFFIVAMFFFVRKMVLDDRLIFTGTYKDSTQYWEEGLANMMISIYNLAIVFFAFWITQILFWIVFLRRYKKLIFEYKVSNDFLEK